MHDFIHDKGCTCHVAGIFHKGNKKVEQQDIGQEDNYASYTTNDSVNNQVFQRARTQEGFCSLCNKSHEPFDGLLRVFSQYKGSFEHDVQKDEENGESPETVGHDAVYHSCKRFRVMIILGEGILQGS